MAPLLLTTITSPVKCSLKSVQASFNTQIPESDVLYLGLDSVLERRSEIKLLQSLVVAG